MYRARLSIPTQTVITCPGLLASQNDQYLSFRLQVYGVEWMIAFVFVGCQTQHNFHLIGALGCASQKIMKHQKLRAASVHAREEEKETYSFL